VQRISYEAPHYATASLLGPNILFSTLFSNTLNLCSSLNVREQVSHPIYPTKILFVTLISPPSLQLHVQPIVTSLISLHYYVTCTNHKVLRVVYHLGDLDIDGRTILKRILWTGCKDVEWIYLAQDRIQWQAVVNTVMNLRLPLKAGDD